MLKIERQDAHSWKGTSVVLGKTEIWFSNLAASWDHLGSLNKSLAQAHPRDSGVGGGAAVPAGWGDVKSTRVSPLAQLRTTPVVGGLEGAKSRHSSLGPAFSTPLEAQLPIWVWGLQEGCPKG